MQKVIRFFIQNSLLVNLGILLITFVGIMSARQLNSSFFPSIEERFILIEAVYPGASPQEVEEGITLKIEENLKGIAGVDRVTSTSTENAANIQVELDYGQNADLILQDVKNAVDQISNFPVDMERLVVYVQENQNFTAKIAVQGEGVSLNALKERAEALEDGLRALPNISKISLQGYTSPEIEISVREAQLRNYRLTFEDIARAVQAENIQTTGGTIKGEREVIIRANSKDYTADNLRNLVLRTLPDGNVVYLRDVAEVQEDWSENTSKAYYNGQQAILVTVNTLDEENILNAAAAVRGYLETFNAQNSAVQAVLVDDGTQALNERISLLQENGIVGALIVFVLLALFLKIRLAFWVALGIPISFLGMFVLASLAGITINVLSLFGMILVIGILVDDGIVVGENVYQHYERGASKFQAVLKGTLEVIPSILSAIATTCLAFGFFFFIDGQLGAFFSEVAFIVIAALGFSLLEVLLFLPAHLAHIKDLTPEAKPGKLKMWVENLLLRFRDGIFRPILDFVLRYKVFSLLVLLASMVITISAVRSGMVKTTFFPNIEQNSINVNLEMPSGTPERATEQVLLGIEQAALNLNQRYAEEFGEGIIIKRELVLGPGSNQANATFYLLPAEQRSVKSAQVSTDLRETVGPIPEAEELSFETRTPFGKPLNVSFAGEDFTRLRQAVDDFKAQALATDMVKDLTTNDRADQPEIHLELTDAGRALGLTPQNVMRQVRNGFFGYEAQRLQRGTDEVKVWVRYDMDDRDEVAALASMRIRTPQGNEVPVGQVATLQPVNGLIAVNHIDGKRQITVQGELASLEITSTEMIGKVQEEVLPLIQQRYPDIAITLEGQQRELGKTFGSIARVGPIILVLMLSLLIITFRSISQSIALLATLPFGILGTVWGHYLHDASISLLSFLGFIALLGVIVNDGLVYINAFNRNLQDGMKFDVALRETSLSRFRPIFLTTITTAAGLGPLILEKSFQAQFLIPMAITIAYGLLVGSLLLTLMLPVFLALVNRVKVWALWLWEGQKPSKESIEKAIVRQENSKEYETL